MKKTALFAIAALIVAPASIFAGHNSNVDPTVMTVGGRDVRLSEFEYLYKKNNAQLSADMTLDAYIDMFVNYKLKVCAAMDAGIDTMASYRRDMAMYADELAAPYMIDREMTDSLVAAAYSHCQSVLSIRHLLLPSKTDLRDEVAQRAFADSLRSAAVAGADFEALIREYSVDPSAKRLSGRMMLSGMFSPYEFEDMANRTAPGEFSPVFATRFGLHLIRVDECIKNPGEIKTRHILKRFAPGDSIQAAKALAAVDSLRGVILSGADFASVASAETDDPSGRQTGGDLPWFGLGRMVSEFEEAAYSLSDGELSVPVRTDFGYHLILREASRQVLPLDSVRENLEQGIMRDGRSELVARRAVDRYAAQSNSRINDKTTKKVRGVLEKCKGLNDRSRQKIAGLKDAAFVVDGVGVAPAEIMPAIAADCNSVDSAMLLYVSAVDARFVAVAGERMRATLADREPGYRNLYNEYSDGMLLYEISNSKVWDRANVDVEGLEAYFQNHRDDYKWDCPHYKGYVVSAESDSIASAAADYLSGLDVDASAYVTELRKRFGTTAKIERVITAKGASPIVDYIAFGGDMPEAGDRWKAFRPFRGEVAEQPASAMDVKGAVGVDYQQYLEDQWLRELHEKYSVNVDRELIKSRL